MRLCECLGGGWVVPEMNADVVAPAIGGGDLGYGLVHLPWLGRDVGQAKG
jgi:hypothetical protein